MEKEALVILRIASVHSNTLELKILLSVAVHLYQMIIFMP